MTTILKPSPSSTTHTHTSPPPSPLSKGSNNSPRKSLSPFASSRRKKKIDGSSGSGGLFLPKFLFNNKDETSSKSHHQHNQITVCRPYGTADTSLGGLPTFTITYSKNNESNNNKGCSGKQQQQQQQQQQEYKTAVSCVKSIFPECQIIPNEVQRIPMRVTITAQFGEGDNNGGQNNNSSSFRIWQGRQQNLTRADVPTRTLTMREIMSNLETFRNKIGMT